MQYIQSVTTKPSYDPLILCNGPNLLLPMSVVCIRISPQNSTSTRITLPKKTAIESRILEGDVEKFEGQSGSWQKHRDESEGVWRAVKRMI